MLGAQMRVTRVTSAIIDEAAANLGLRLMATPEPRRLPARFWAAVALLLAVVVVVVVMVMPADSLIAGLPPAAPGHPRKPFAQPVTPPSLEEPSFGHAVTPVATAPQAR
jgi:hypothetical protein